MNKPRRIDFYADEWIAGTQNLTAEERGVYISICALIYSHDGPIPLAGLHKLCGCRADAFRRVKNRLIEAGKVFENHEEISVKRCENELEKAHKRLEKSSENGSKGGRPSKHINGIGKPGGSPGGKLAGASFNLQPTTTNHQPKESHSNECDARASPRAPHSHKQEFKIWWDKYPHKIGRGAAEKAYEKALAKTSDDQLIIGVERYKATKPPDRQWCNPATWLNRESWLDQPAEVRPNGASEPFLPLHETGRRPTGPPPERL